MTPLLVSSLVAGEVYQMILCPKAPSRMRDFLNNFTTLCLRYVKAFLEVLL